MLTILLGYITDIFKKLSQNKIVLKKLIVLLKKVI